MASIVPDESVTILIGCHYLASDGGHFDFGQPIGELLFRGRAFGPGNTDTIYMRLKEAVLPRLGSSVKIPIEMIKVQLESSQPVLIEGREFDASIILTPGKRSTGEMRITLHSDDDGTPSPHGTYDTNVAIFFDATLTPRDRASPSITRSDNIFIQSTSHGLWSLNPAPNMVTVIVPEGDGAGDTRMRTANFYVVGTTPMLDNRTLAGGANTAALE